eukprot:505061_1
MKNHCDALKRKGIKVKMINSTLYSHSTHSTMATPWEVSILQVITLLAVGTITYQELESEFDDSRCSHHICKYNEIPLPTKPQQLTEVIVVQMDQQNPNAEPVINGVNSRYPSHSPSVDVSEASNAVNQQYSNVTNPYSRTNYGAPQAVQDIYPAYEHQPKTEATKNHQTVQYLQRCYGTIMYMSPAVLRSSAHLTTHYRGRISTKAVSHQMLTKACIIALDTIVLLEMNSVHDASSVQYYGEHHGEYYGQYYGQYYGHYDGHHYALHTAFTLLRAYWCILLLTLLYLRRNRPNDILYGVKYSQKRVLSHSTHHLTVYVCNVLYWRKNTHANSMHDMHYSDYTTDNINGILSWQNISKSSIVFSIYCFILLTVPYIMCCLGLWWNDRNDITYWFIKYLLKRGLSHSRPSYYLELNTVSTLCTIRTVLRTLLRTLLRTILRIAYHVYMLSAYFTSARMMLKHSKQCRCNLSTHYCNRISDMSNIKWSIICEIYYSIKPHGDDNDDIRNASGIHCIDVHSCDEGSIIIAIALDISFPAHPLLSANGVHDINDEQMHNSYITLFSRPRPSDTSPVTLSYTVLNTHISIPNTKMNDLLSSNIGWKD